MAGETLHTVFLSADGLTGDRAYAFESSNAPAGMLRLTALQRRGMLQFRAWTDDDGCVQVTTPSGGTFPVDAPTLPQHFADPGTYRLVHSYAPQTDVRPIAIHTVRDMAALSSNFGSNVDPRRFRSNLVFDLDMPLTTNSILSIGREAQLELLEPIPRCRFITYDPAMPMTGEPLFGLMRHLDRHHGGRMGIYARVRAPGNIRAGDVVSLVCPPASNTA